MTDFDTTTAPQAEPNQDQPELNERDLNEVAGGLNFTRTPAKPAVDSF